MALIKCLECNRDVSDKAANCPHCGYPLGRTASGLRRVQVIERTERRWKALRALGWLLILAGVVVFLRELAADDFRGAALGWWLGGAGVACLVTSSAGAWWYHG